MHSVALSPTKLSSLPMRFCLLPLVLAGLLLPAAAWAQVTYTGSAATQNFGSQAIGSPSAARTFNFSVAAGTTVGSIGVLTTGIANLDFANATASTCIAQTYASATTCTVNLTFTPKAVGLRMGAVVYFSGVNNTGTVLGKVLVRGTGTGPQIAFSPGIATAIDPTVNGEGFDGTGGVAVNAEGDLFVSDIVHERVVEVPAGGGTPTAIAAPCFPYNLAVDGAGDLFIDRKSVV